MKPYAFLIFLNAALANFAFANGSGEPSQYEAITGESADEDRSFWDSYYKNKDFVHGKDAVSYLKENIQKIPKGKAFVPAMGEGRNAVFLAKNGFNVIANDISEVALDKARVLAKKQKVNMKTSVVDLKQYKFPESEFDFVLLSLFIDRSLMPGFKKTLKRGGYIMFYQELYEGDPKKAKSLFWVRPKEIQALIKDFEMIDYREYTDHGMHVVGALARKP